MGTRGASFMIRLITAMLLLLSIQIISASNEVPDFGANPGELKMFLYLPDKMEKETPLVVLLHGCLQEAQTFSKESGWLDYAKKYNFALLIPGQQKANNGANCFNWFLEDDIKRESGETASLFNMMTHLLKNYSIDKKKVFISGFSAGASMTGVMLANYPKLFSAGAIVAGVPFGCASSTIRGLTCMAGLVRKSAKKWASFIREISSNQKSFPRISIWSGSKDRIVNSSNSDQILKQWLNLHFSFADSQMIEKLTEEELFEKRSYTRKNDVVVEYYKIKNYPHGQPIFTGKDDKNCGAESRFVIEAGICAAYHQAKFFKLF